MAVCGWVIGEVEPVVVTDGLTRRFGDLVAVDHLALQIGGGAVFGLLGRNGAGKTTIKMLITLLAPTSGSACVAGFDVRTQARRVRQVIGYVPQLLSADGSLTAWENLLVFSRLYRIPHAQRRARIEHALAFMGLEEAAHKLVRDFSGGMIRRLEIAESRLHRPAVLFLYEPTIGLDPAARRGVWNELQAFVRTEGTTLVLTTHDMEEAEALCDDIAIVHFGRLVARGSPGTLAASIGPGATLDDAFIDYTGRGEMEGGLRDVARTRRAAGRLG